MRVYKDRLIGKELLDFIRDTELTDRDEIILEAGYSRKLTLRDGRPYLSPRRHDFWDAVAAAQGLDALVNPANSAAGGPRLTYQAKVSSKGVVTIGAGYTRQLGLGPGTSVQIDVCPHEGKIALSPAATEPKEELPEAQPAPWVAPTHFPPESPHAAAMAA